MSLADIDAQVLDGIERLSSDLPFFASRALHIRDKAGDVHPFHLNQAQKFIHARIEDQLKRTGKVRVLIVKGRQLGSSTYIEGRFYHKLWRTHRTLEAFILTHEMDATENIFGMATRFHEKHPDIYLKPPTEAANAKELRFSHNGCGYHVATAGSKGTGRSATFQLFHGSEVAFWPNAESHTLGAFQAVGDAAGTEIILESTADGVANFFYKQAQAAIRGESDFEAIFVPWFWGEDYQRPCPDGWNTSTAWLDYAKAHKLTWEQLYWAFVKNRELANSISASHDEPCWKFQQEYPATFDEAFQSSGNSFIPATSVLKARKPAEAIIGTGPVIIGVDPARSGDKVGIIDRCGRRMGERISQRMDPGGSVTYVAGQVAAIINRLKPDMVNIDVGSNGAGVYDILMDQGYGYCLNAVNFGSNPLTKGPTGDDVYFNRRAEMYDLMRQWFDGPTAVQIPDDDALQGDLVSAQWGPGATRYNTSNELIIEEKAAIKLRLGASPDLGDAAALTFAVPYAIKLQSNLTRPERRRGNRRTGY